MIPEFDGYGLLPPGIHDCTLDEIRHRFRFTARRIDLFADMQRFLSEEWQPLGLPCPLLIDGSFARNKPMPEDIDIAIDAAAYDLPTAIALALQVRTRHDAIKAVYNVDLWTSHPHMPNRLDAYFQYVGEKASPELQLPPRHPKGILRLSP